jgi:hypothetical protein
MATSEDSINTLTDKINAKVAEYRANYETGSRADLDTLNREVLAFQQQRGVAIAEGCSACPSCGEQPVGMIQKLVVSREEVDGFEIGCQHCLDHRAKGTDLAGARAAWERGPSSPEERDGNGAITKRAVRGWVKPDGRKLVKTASGILSTLSNGTTINWSSKLTLEARGKLRRAAVAATPAIPKISRATDETETLAAG